MNILFTRFPLVSALHGGAENQTMALMEGLRAKGHEVRFLGSCEALLQRTKEIGIKNQELRIGKPPVIKWSAVSFLWRKNTMRRQLIREVELIAGRSPLTAIVMLSLTEKLLLTEWAAQRNIKVFWLEHDRIGPWLRWNPWLPALKRASKYATIICVSELSRKKYIEMGFESERVVAIPNGVQQPETRNLSAAHYPLPATHSRRKNPALVCISRLSPEKGVGILIQSIADLPQIDLVIVGSGPEEGYLRQLIDEDTRRLGVGTPRIHIIRDVPNLESVYASADALILPSSDHDPFGLVAAEAMMRGIPVIVTDSCGIAGYLQNADDALIAEAGSVSSLAGAIQSLEDPQLRERIGSTGQKTALQTFSLDRMVAKYEELIEQ
jgi:glycosyltransferase involved in cell wall biosynthesis